MQVFGKDIIAPMFHHMFPEREYAVAKMKLPSMSTYLTLIRLAYPSFKKQLRIATAREDLTARQQAVLRNITDLVEFFIPVVLLVLFVIALPVSSAFSWAKSSFYFLECLFFFTEKKWHVA